MLEYGLQGYGVKALRELLTQLFATPIDAASETPADRDEAAA